MKLEGDEVVISGIGGYFPKSKNVEELKQHLLANEVLLDQRWKCGERGCTNIVGKIDIENFDNAFFGINRQMSTYLDHMHRLVLERTFEALLDAGVNPQELRGRQIGCFMGASIGENDNIILESVVSGFGVTGHSRGMLANRVSFWLDLKGPSLAYDSNWVGGVEIIRVACESIKSGKCEACIIGSANLALNSEFQFLFTDMGLLSVDGSNKSFDAEACGYARSDGIVVMYVQKATEAKRCYGSIEHVATVFDGNREGKLMEIDEQNMTEFISEFYETAKVDPREVEFVEANGTAIKQIDKQEIAALEKVFCKNRKTPLLIGSIKPNTGHSEASSVLFSVAKAIVAMESEIIPATVQYTKPNPEIPALVNGSIQVVTENRKWNPKYVAVNAIGLDSYYGHILLKANPKKLPSKINDLPRLLLASTRTDTGIKKILETFKRKEDISDEYMALVQNVHAKPILGHLYRGYSVHGSEETKSGSEHHLGNKRQIWFVYPGMGSQWAGMASDLMKIPVFNEAIQKCHKIIQTKGIDLIKVITSTDKSVFDNILHIFVGIASIQIALTDVLHSIGIIPDGIIGHSLGELGCAYADGCVTAEQMLLCAYAKGRASLEADLIPGMMAAIGLGYHQIKDKCPPSIDVACHNGPDSSTISGPTEDMEKFVEKLQYEGIFARLVNVANVAYHSRYIKPAAPLLMKYFKEVIPIPVLRSKKWITTSIAEEDWGTDLALYSSPEHHTNNLLSNVFFEEGLQHIPKDSILIEIAPHGLLQPILKRSVKMGCTNVSLTNRGTQSGVEFLFNTLGKLYLSGVDMSVHNLYPKIEFPVSRGTPSLAPLSHWEHSEAWRSGHEDKAVSVMYGVKNIDISLNNEEFRHLVGHKLNDQVILPASTYMNIVANIMSSISSRHEKIVFEDLYFRKYLTIPEMGGVAMYSVVQKGSGFFELLADEEIVLTGKISYPMSTDKFMFDDTDIEIHDDSVKLSANDIYTEFQHRGCKYSGPFRTMKNLILTEDGSVGTVPWNGEWHMFLEGIFQQFLFHAGECDQDIQTPRTIQKISLSQNDLPSEKCDLTVHYNYYTNILATKGVQVVGMTSSPIPRKQGDVSYDSVEFFPLKNEKTKMDMFLNAAIYLAMDNIGGSKTATIMITEIETPERVHSSLALVLEQYKKFNPTLARVSSFEEVNIQQTCPSLFIYNDYITQDLARIIAASDGFAVVKTNQDIFSQSQVFQLAQCTIDGTSYSLLRKVIPTDPRIIQVKSDTLTTKDISRGSEAWMDELTSAVSENSEEIVLLVSTLIPEEGLINFVQELRSQPNMQKVCCLFDLDREANESNMNDSLYKNIYKQAVGLSIIKDNTFGIYLPVPVSLEDDLTLNTFASSNVIDDKTIEYLSVNLSDETLDPEFFKPVQLGNLDYAGMTNSGKAIMGLARFNKDTCKIEPDPILHWEIPELWTIQDGATVPYAYTCAYYALKYKAELKPGKTVLVHGGCTSIGMAAISVASTLGCTVYTTVLNNTQRAFLKKHFVFLKDRHIFSCKDTSFAPSFMNETGKDGADYLMNCLSGTLLQASMDCIGTGGKIIQYGKFDLEENNSMGMLPFDRNASLYVLDFDNLLSLRESIKLDLKKWLWEGINTKGVRPLHRKVVDHQDIRLLLHNMRRSENIGKVVLKLNNTIQYNRFNVENPNKFSCDAKRSYLIYGGTAEAWTDLAEWLVFHGARRILVASDSKPQLAHINRHLSLLRSYFNAEIVISQNKPYSRESAAELLSEAKSLGEIHMVFLLPITSSVTKTNDNRTVQYIDHSLRTTAPNASLVNLINSATGLTEDRNDVGFATHNIQYDEGLEISTAINCLDTIFSLKAMNVIIRDNETGDVNQESTAALFKKLDSILPPSIEELTQQYLESPTNPDFIQLPTSGPRKIRELAPIFIMPGLCNEKGVEDLALDLLYPTFCADYSQQSRSVLELAIILVARMKEIWPAGPYTLVGVSWGGPLTIEMAHILEQQKASFHIYLIDGAPKTLKMALLHLGESSDDLEMNLITRYFKIKDARLIEKLTSLNDWKSKIALVLQEYEGILKNRDAVTKALTNLKNRLGEINTYRQSDVSLSGEIHLLRPTGCSKHDGCDMLSASKRTLQVHVIEGDHKSIVKSQETALLINQTFSLI